MAISYLLRHFNILGRNAIKDVELYFKQCSVDITTDSLAMMGATLAYKGINPLTKKRCVSEKNLRHILSIILTCGMYNYSGEWVFDIGLPAQKWNLRWDSHDCPRADGVLRFIRLGWIDEEIVFEGLKFVRSSRNFTTSTSFDMSTPKRPTEII